MDEVLTALEQQVECYRALAKLAEAQHEHVQQNATEQLLLVLSRRQEVLDRIASLEAAIAPARKQWGAFVAALDPQRRVAADAMLAETRMLLEQITAADRNDALVLQQRKLNLSREISQATAARRVNRSYAAAAYGAANASMDVKK